MPKISIRFSFILSLPLCLHSCTYITEYMALSLTFKQSYWEANTFANLKIMYIGCLNLTSPSFYPSILVDKALRLEEWPKIKAVCSEGPRLIPEGVEILFDPTQRASLSQVKPTHGNTGIDFSVSFPRSLSATPLCEPFQLGKLVLICNAHTSLQRVGMASVTVHPSKISTD